MNRVVAILIVIFAFYTKADASHLIGAEITYKHKSDYLYSVYVTVYRDCNECKIAGEGGGTNTKDCGTFPLYLRSSDRNSCTGVQLDQLSLTYVSSQDILPLCETATSKCDGDSGLKYGIEALTFTTDIDFSEYTAYKNCGFDMYIQIAQRVDDIDNIVQSSFGEYLFNYSYINPFVTHNSPQFRDNPPLILPLNQPVRTYVMKYDDDGHDSISIHLSEPLKKLNTKIDYSTGYSLKKPLSVWCNGDKSCTANPLANPPIGITLDPETGYMAFTPFKNNEKATLVFEIEKWKKVNGTNVLVSCVRRDVVVETSNIGAYNNAPALSGTSLGPDNDMELCAGEELCFSIKASDMPFKFPDGSTQKPSSVTYEWTTNIDGIQIKQVETSSAPYFALEVCWTPTKAQGGKDFELIVTATDDNCPLQAYVENRYSFYVKPAPETHAKVNKLWCGNLELISDSTKNQSYKEVTWKFEETPGTERLLSNNFHDTVPSKESMSGNILVEVTNNDGCRSLVSLPIDISDDEIYEDFGIVEADAIYCHLDTVKLKANVTNGVKYKSVVWYSNGEEVSTESIYTFIANASDETPTITAKILGVKGNLSCNDMIEHAIVVEIGPAIDFQKDVSVCINQGAMNLNDYVGSSNGEWYGVDHNLILDDSILNVAVFGNSSQPVEVCTEYRLKSAQFGCESRDTFCTWLLPEKKINLERTTVCGASGFFNLTNMDNNLFSFGTDDIEWMVDGQPLKPNPLNKPHLLELAGLSLGNHTVIGKLTNIYGCTSIDTGILVLLDDIDLSYVKDTSLCQGNTQNLSELFNIQTGGGSWFCYNDAFAVNEVSVNPGSCGLLNLNYTYDQFGCNASIDVNLKVVCNPEVTYLHSDTVCASYDYLKLESTPHMGVFTGENVKDGKLKITEANRYNEIQHAISIEGCTFTDDLVVIVEPKPRVSMSGNFPAAICENEVIELRNIEVNNGMFLVGTTMKPDTIFDNLELWQYKPKSIGETVFVTQLIGKGDCPIETNTHRVTVNPLARINLLDSALVGCTPFTYKPKVMYDQDRNDWDNVDVTWSFGNTVSTNHKIAPNQTFKTAGNYSVALKTVTTNGCTYEREWPNALRINASPDASFIYTPSGVISIREPKVVFTNTSTSVDSVKYRWDFGTGNPNDVSDLKSPVFYFAQDTGLYNVNLTATTAKGCVDFAEQKVFVGPDIQIFVPSAFSPNGKDSKITEEFKVVGNNVKTFHLEIYNRWGQRVYTSDDINEQWDGKFGGKYCEVGIFAYYIKATSLSGEFYELKGTINLLR